MDVGGGSKEGGKGTFPHTHENFFCALNLCARPVYPNVHVLLQLLATLPVSTAELERMLCKVDSKSAARCLKTRLEAVVLMQAHRQQVTELATNDIIDKFAACGSRKLKIFISTAMLLSVTYV